MNTEVKAFCDKHYACSEGRAWAVANCATMADVFDKCHRSDWLLWALRKDGRTPATAYVKVACAFARRVLHVFESARPGNDRPRKAIEAAERGTPDAADADYAAYAAYAADDADERKAQSDLIRSIVENPWCAR